MSRHKAGESSCGCSHYRDPGDGAARTVSDRGRGRPGGSGPVAQLAITVISPRQDRTVASQGKDAVGRRRNCNHAADRVASAISHWNWVQPLDGGAVAKLARTVVAPGHDRAIRLERDIKGRRRWATKPDHGDSNDVDDAGQGVPGCITHQAWRQPANRRPVAELSVGVNPPCEDRAIHPDHGAMASQAEHLRAEPMSIEPCDTAHRVAGAVEKVPGVRAAGGRTVPELPVRIGPPSQYRTVAL